MGASRGGSSWSNRQERRDALADAMAETWRTQLRLDGQDEAIVEARLEKSRDRLQRAPVLIIPCLYLAGLDIYPDADRQQAEETMAVQSLGAAVQNLLLSLYAAGVDGGWMCAPLFCPDVVQAALGLDADAGSARADRRRLRGEGSGAPAAPATGRADRRLAVSARLTLNPSETLTPTPLPACAGRGAR